MNRENIQKMRELLESVRSAIDAVRHIVDEEALQVGDRNMMEREINVVRKGVDKLLHESAAMLADPTRIE